MVNEINEILTMFNLKVPKLNLEKINKIKVLGEGSNGVVYLIEYVEKMLTLKIQPNYIDTPNFIINNKEIICSNTPINDLIISYFISQLNKSKEYIQKFYGYNITQNEIWIIKEFIKLDFIEFLKKKNISYQDKLLTTINLFLVLYETFQNSIKGFHQDFKLENILIKKTNIKSLTIDINGKKFKSKVNGYIPVLTDYGASFIFKIKNKKTIIRRFHKNFYKTNIHNCNQDISFNYYNDLNNFYNFNRNVNLKLIPKEILYVLSDIHDNMGEKYLTVENILNHKLIQKYLLN